MVPQYYVCIKSQKVDTSITYMIECIQGLMPKKKKSTKNLLCYNRISINLTLYIQYLVTVTQSKCYEYTYTW